MDLRDWHRLYDASSLCPILGKEFFETTYGIPAPIVSSLQSIAIAELEDDDLTTRVRATQWAHKYVWPKLYALYEAGPVQEPHKFQPGDWVHVKRFFQDMLEPIWKGHFIFLLTMPTAIKVDGITSWLHYTDAKPADSFSPKEDHQTPVLPEWKVQKSTNTLKLKITRSWAYCLC